MSSRYRRAFASPGAHWRLVGAEDLPVVLRAHGFAGQLISVVPSSDPGVVGARVVQQLSDAAAQT